MPTSATLIPCHTLIGSLVFSCMFSRYSSISWSHGCSHRWWLSLPHITYGSESALCTTVELWGITMMKSSCPEDPVLLLQTACSAVKKADLYDSDYHLPPHLLTLWRWWNYIHPRNRRTPFQLKKCSSTLLLIKPKVWFNIANNFPWVYIWGHIYPSECCRDCSVPPYYTCSYLGRTVLLLSWIHFHILYLDFLEAPTALHWVASYYLHLLQ